jgi:thioredoxin reductase
MNREQAIELQKQGNPCIYIGRTSYLRDRKLYIKHVRKLEAIVTSRLQSRDYDDYHHVKLENLVADNQVITNS